MRRERDLNVIDPTRRLTIPRRLLTLVIGLMALFAQTGPAPVQAAQTWEMNVYDSRAFLYQDPYSTACVAASTMMMLNMIAYRQTGGPAFAWTPYKVKNNAANPRDYRDMTSILYWTRAHDTLSIRGGGSDPHGWRNALNGYGWGSASLTDPAKRMYDDLQFTSYDAAVHAVVRAIARYRMPVGILAWTGGHAQVVTGYVVDGEDPAYSDAFAVKYLYVSDPLYKDHFVNTRVSNASFKGGPWQIRFQSYRHSDSPYDDGYSSGWRRSSVLPTTGSSEWYGKWVIIAPVQAGVPLPDPTPTPTPTPPPSSPPAPTPTPPPAAPAAPQSAAPSPAPSATPSAEPQPSAPASVTP